MDKINEKYKLIEWILNLEDEFIINSIKRIKEHPIYVNKNDNQEEVKKAVTTEKEITQIDFEIVLSEDDSIVSNKVENYIETLEHLEPEIKPKKDKTEVYINDPFINYEINDSNKNRINFLEGNLKKDIALEKEDLNIYKESETPKDNIKVINLKNNSHKRINSSLKINNLIHFFDDDTEIKIFDGF